MHFDVGVLKYPAISADTPSGPADFPHPTLDANFGDTFH